jgi:Uma2 family endonuclease
MAAQPNYPLLTADEFLRMDFGDNHKAELDNGVIRMMAGGTGRHARVQSNILVALGVKLRGSGGFQLGSDMATRTHDLSIRYPDASVFCGHADQASDEAKAWTDPRVLFEVLSKGTARTDLRVKIEEYKAMPSVDTIVYVDIGDETLRIVQRTGPDSWTDENHREPHDVPLPALDITLTHAEIFARD